MNNLLGKVIWKKKGKLEILSAAFGFLIGLVLLLLIIQINHDFNTIFTSKFSDSKQVDYVILSKKIDISHSFNFAEIGFTEFEINNIMGQPFVKSLARIIANNFSVNAVINFGNAAYSTELFFESIPDDYLDEIPDSWGWNGDNEFLPVIISKDFYNLYNFGFAVGRGLPMISEDVISQIPFIITVSGPGGKINLQGKIVGFTDSISSFLIPYSFMQWANKNIALNESEPPLRLILSVTDKGDPRISEFVKQTGYDTNKRILGLSEAKGIIQALFVFIGFLGVAFISLSVSIFIINFQLIISHSMDEIQLLNILGYKKSTLVNSLIFFLIILLVFAWIIGLVICVFITNIIHNFLLQIGFNDTFSLNPFVFLYSVIIIVFCLGINYFVISRKLD